ncbi:MAG TPA: bifunctional transaldolase/phosoglucose isomerase [Bryobacteraceae bacterium]|jgi:transaldolase/glucose-6-phosphate isomerase
MSITYSLPGALNALVESTLADWTANGKVSRLWNKDPLLWTNAGEEKWLGWLDVVDEQVAAKQSLNDFQAEVKARGFANILLLGMGGSSLCPEVLEKTFGAPGFYVLDSTDPAQVTAFANKVDLENTLFFVSSKSGSTLEPNIFKQYFFDRSKKPGNFVAVTDPGSHMEKVAKDDGFWKIFYGVPSIGGRYSALSNFGMAPAAAMGIDIDRFLESAQSMVQACKNSTAVENPGVMLGTILGVAGTHGHDKITIVASPAIHNLGAWLEQLLAESTGKIGKGLIPVDREGLGAPDVYGDDRVFAYVRLEGAEDPAQVAALDALEAAGKIVVRMTMPAKYDLGAEFFRWEIATAVAGTILGINTFDQPDVEASKIETKKLTTQYEETGSLPAEAPVFETGGIKLFPAGTLTPATQSLEGYLKAHLDRIGAGDYFGLLAYIQMTDEHEEVLQKMRMALRDKKKVATCLGFGPRFLHSTGQAYKGGPNSGVFLQLTCDDAVDVQVPGQKYTFGIVKAAQARGDFAVLAERHRRALRVHLPADLESGLKRLSDALLSVI